MAPIEAIEEGWGGVPTRFAELCRFVGQPTPRFCAFYAPEQVAANAGRMYGMIPMFLPFAEPQDGDGQYGFFANSPNAEAWPVLFADAEQGFLRPVASGFDAFLRWLTLTARYEASLEEDGDENASGGNGQAAANAKIGGVVTAPELQRLGVPQSLLTGNLPRNGSELSHRLANLDAGDALSQCHLGCAHLLRHENAQALNRFQSAAQAMPWFGDPHYLCADVHRDQEEYAEAIPHWWATMRQPVVFCTRTWEWNLGDDYPEAEIYEVAADCLNQYARFAPAALRADPLWRIVTDADPYDPDARFGLGQALHRQGDLAGAEREFWNALTLGGEEKKHLPERCYDALTELYTRQNRARDLRLLQHDRALSIPA